MYSITQLISASVASKECEAILSDCCRRRLLGASLDQLISATANYNPVCMRKG